MAVQNGSLKIKILKHLIRNYYPEWISCRFTICVMMFTACWTSYMCRLQMPILSVPMIDTSDHVTNSSHSASFCMAPKLVNVSEPKKEKLQDGPMFWNNHQFKWTPTIRGQLIAGYGYGNVPGNLFGGILALKYGPRRIVLWTTIIAGIVTLITPFLSHVHFGVLLLSRVIVGLTGGVVFPACHQLVAKWAPPAEKGRFVWTLLGGTFGTTFTYPMIAAIAEEINWEAAWFIPGLLVFVWVFFWWIFAWDSPAEHPGISETEREFILTAQAGSAQKSGAKVTRTPYGQIFTSIPFICLVISHFGNLFLVLFFQNSVPLYLTLALGFELQKGGWLSGLPWFFRIFFGFFFGWAADFIKARQLMSITALRKTATIFSHFLPGCLLVAVGYSGCRFELAVLCLCLALGFNGAATISNLSNNQDLSPNFAGILYGIMNCIGTMSAFITPPIIEEIAGKQNHSIEAWQTVFWIGAIVCFVSMIVFIIGGSGKTQKWNEPQETTDAQNA